MEPEIKMGFIVINVLTQASVSPSFLLHISGPELFSGNTSKCSKHLERDKRKSKYKKGRTSKKKYIKGGSHNELVTNLYGIVNGMNTGNSNLENLSPEDLKRFQLLSKIHTKRLLPVFYLISLCLDSSKLIN